MITRCNRWVLSSRKYLVTSRWLYLIDTARCNFTLRGWKARDRCYQSTHLGAVANPGPHTPRSSYSELFGLRFARKDVHPRRFRSYSELVSGCHAHSPRFLARLTLLERAIAKGTSVRPSVCLSVCLSHSWAMPTRFKISKYISIFAPTIGRCF